MLATNTGDLRAVIRVLNHIINECIDTNTHGCGICWLEWRQAKDVMNFIDGCINVNTMIIDEFQTLEKSNSATS